MNRSTAPQDHIRYFLQLLLFSLKTPATITTFAVDWLRRFSRSPVTRGERGKESLSAFRARTIFSIGEPICLASLNATSA